MRQGRHDRKQCTELLLDRIILALEDLIVCAPFSSELIAVKPVIWELVSKTFEGLLSVGAELYHGTPCLGLALEVLDKGDEGDRSCGGGVGGTKRLVEHGQQRSTPLRAQTGALPPYFGCESNLLSRRVHLTAPNHVGTNLIISSISPRRCRARRQRRRKDHLPAMSGRQQRVMVQPIVRRVFLFAFSS